MGPAPAAYLPRIDREPAESKLALVRRLMETDPLGFFKELRAERPILVLPECTLVSLYDDVIEMLNMPKIFTVKLYEAKMANGYLMMHDDDALHYREKSIMQGLLNRDDLPEVRRMVRDISRDLLEGAGGGIDAVSGYCRLVPATIVRDYFGLIGMHRKDLMEWSYWAQVDTFYNQPFDIATAEERERIQASHDASGEKLGKYIAALVLTRSIALKFERLWAPLQRLAAMFRKGKRPLRDDIVSRMLRTKFPAEVDFDIKRAGVNAGGLLIGTIETTAQASVQTIQYLLQHADLFDQARNTAREDDPSQFDSIVWEALRFVPISPYMFRQTACGYTLAKGTPHETHIPGGTNVLALTQSAMFDPKAFENPEAFRPNRNWYHYFTFGYGAHECLGKYVGMVMIPEIVRQILLMPGLEAAAGIEYDGHMPKSYPLTWRV
ncbi:MAG: cytochrome P450 [Bryobacterales bacterium]|nr:cytochrome P450 [Bryobacterales bacterium]